MPASLKTILTLLIVAAAATATILAARQLISHRHAGPPQVQPLQAVGPTTKPDDAPLTRVGPPRVVAMGPRQGPANDPPAHQPPRPAPAATPSAAALGRGFLDLLGLPTQAARAASDWATDRLDRSWQFHNIRGRFAFSAGDLVTAETYFLQVCDLAPERAAGHLGLAMVSVQKERLKDAAIQYRKAVDLEPDNVEVLYNFGVLYSRLKDWHEAESYYNRVLAIQHDHLWATYNLASIATLYDRLGEARYLWRRVLTLAPDWEDARYQLGLVHYQLKEYDQAIEQFNLLLKTQGQNADLYNNIGLCCQGRNQYTEAMRYFSRAYQLQPMNKVIVNNLADLCLVLYQQDVRSRRYLNQALIYYRQSLSMDSGQPRIKALVEYLERIDTGATTQPDLAGPVAP
ncbi:MAG: Photosystem I assembly protein Ycf3 [Phycisphaerae bacterium]|nr:Photosystem I assembly protein Ycf3 [Phycisphaerae bacterium]